MMHQLKRRRKMKNPVAKFMNKFNKPATQVDRKKAQKAGKVKHRSQITD